MQTSGAGVNSSADGAGVYPFASFDRPTKSGTGDRWIMLCRNTGLATQNEMYVVGQGASYTLVAVEGITEIESGRFFSTLDRYADVNDDGVWVGIG
ncbi:MAG: hypothetical protein AAFS11_05545, partial [Planctomycetota bacterium]